MTSINEKGTITVPQTPSYSSIDDLDFGTAADNSVVMPITKEAQLKWFNGAATDQQTMATGFHIESGINPLLDETLAGMGMQHYIVEHRTVDKDGNTQKPYWRVDPCSLIVIAKGVLSPFQMRETSDRTGIVYAREVELDEQGQPKRYDDGKRNIKLRKVLKLRAFVHEMVAHGYSEWLPLRLTGNIADFMLEALAKNFDVLKAFNGFTGRTAPFYGFSIPLAASPTRKMVGPKEGAQSPIYPMQPRVPTTIDTAYLLQHATPEDLVLRIREELLTEALIWSIEESERIAKSGLPEGEQLLGLPESSTTSRHLQNGTARQGASLDPLVQQAQIDWIVKDYCGNNQGVIQAILEHFSLESANGEQFTDLTQLRMSHVRALAEAKKGAEKENIGQVAHS